MYQGNHEESYGAICLTNEIFQRKKDVCITKEWGYGSIYITHTHSKPNFENFSGVEIPLGWFCTIYHEI